MKLLANENFPMASVQYLLSKGFDITAVGTDNMSVSDKEVMEIAIREERTILTFDRDYGELIFKYAYKPQKGVIYLRLSQYTPEEPGKIIEELLSRPSFKPDKMFTVLTEDSIRQRKIFDIS
jgi:predicted nuclease of predicted toxin-antitoxin system